MIRKLKGGKSRLYSRKKDEKTGKRHKWEHSTRARRRRSMSGRWHYFNGVRGYWRR
ncbi:hypothetical protein [Mesorhizobium sp. M7A.T.Ca.TU.009.02.1.1]|uniref:hypothetical protein n=1 Tax=Mesorhizobium sp. M7A.T.Ca.TU.009.02.1.1 TaxID=2496791 RepID=UPI0019CF5687|nr:hypothetical protein [Mesorhizobium sp. M7A.T.Ca.TU.009.02.1.1]